jgi:hypothetical protein
MSLSNETYQKLSSALKNEVIDYIHNDERYVDFMMELVPDAICSKLGEVDQNVLVELSMCVMDKIMLR